MSKTKSNRGWKWAYQKIRSLHASRCTAAYRATLYCLRGDSGPFTSHAGWAKSRIRHD